MTFTHAIFYVGAPYGDGEMGHLVSRHTSEEAAEAALARMSRDAEGHETDARRNHRILPYVSRAHARRIAEHLVGGVHVVAARSKNDKTWGYNYASGRGVYTTCHSGTYQQARIERAEHVRDLAAEIEVGIAPSWATLDFKW